MISRRPIPLSPQFRCLPLCLLFFLLTLIPFKAHSTEPDLQASAPTEAPQRFITIDFDNVDILLFIKYISELTGKNFIIDKTVRGSVSIISPTKISETEAYRVFESVLAINGFTTVEAGAMTKIMPSVRARTENIDTLRHGDTSNPEDRIVTQLIPLTHTTPTEIKKVLAPLVSKTSMVIAHTQSGMLIVTDTLSNIQKLLAIIESIDVPYSSNELEVVVLENATASTLATTLNAIFIRSAAAPQKGTSASAGVKVVPYDRINALILLAGPGDLLRVKQLISTLDTVSEKDEGNIQVVYLQHANAKELAAVLTNLPGQQSDDKKGPKKAPSISTDVQIMPDEETNSLIITASRSEFKVLDNVIRKLDIPRRMVYLEALIMEVDTDTSFDVGVNWIGGGSFDDNTGSLLTGWGGSGGFAADGAVTTNADGIVSVGTGFTMGVLKQGIQIGGINFPNIAAVLKAYKSDSNINIIATPQILTTDNKEAKISVGENRPYLTRTSEETSGTGYQNYEYKDIATTLTITPQINQADTLRLEIATEVSKLNASASEVDRPVTFKRTANTTVLVQDAETIVIGGIIGHDATEADWKIPLLGDIPLLGWLFKTHSTNHLKTNMFIFITPHIIKNPADIARVTLTKEEQIDKVMPEVKDQLHRQVNLDHAMPLSDRGFQKMMNRQYDEAKNFFNEALDINPNSPYALMNMGIIYESEGKDTEAIQYYQQVIDIGKNIGSELVDANLQQLCLENIDRLKQQKETWPYQENNDM